MRKQFNYLGFNDMGKTTTNNQEGCDMHVVSFSLFDKVYMDSPFGRYTGVVKGVEESKVIIESHSPNGKGTMLADYDLKNNDWQKY